MGNVGGRCLDPSASGGLLWPARTDGAFSYLAGNEFVLFERQTGAAVSGDRICHRRDVYYSRDWGIPENSGRRSDRSVEATGCGARVQRLLRC